MHGQPIFLLRPGSRARTAPALQAPSFRRLTIALTELCNLDCWMCDFARSKGLTKHIPMKPEEIVQLLGHRFFRSLFSVTLTGGEPFAYPGLEALVEGLRGRYPALQINFSSNATLL